MTKSRLSSPNIHGYERESDLKRDIVAFLELNKIFCWKNHTSGIRGRKLGNNDGKGSADILGIYHGKFLAIEVKLPGGRVSVEQRLFLQLVKDHGGIAILAKSLEDVQRGLFN